MIEFLSWVIVSVFFCEFEDVVSQELVGFSHAFGEGGVRISFHDVLVVEDFAADAVFAEEAEGVLRQLGAFGAFVVHGQGADAV